MPQLSPLHAVRRARLLDALPDRCVAVFPATRVAQRNSDVEHVFRQDSDLQYLTGFEEPEAVAILTKKGDERRFELVVRPRDKEREIWDGRRAGVDGAVAEYGADEAHETSKREDALLEAFKGADVLVYSLGAHAEMDATVLRLLSRFRALRRKLPPGPTQVLDPATVLHEMRLVKSPGEVELLQRAADITVAGHNAAMRACRPGLGELQVQAVVEGTFRFLGSPRNGYPSIVAGGANATCLHYTDNDQELADGDLLLIDAGAECGYYTADITRTFPVGGRFSEDQAAVYQVVLDAQLAALEASVVGATFDDVHRVALRRLTEGMVRIGLLEGDVDELIESEGYKRCYMHRTGHWLGLDVHDVGSYRDGDEDGARKLEPGMVMTIEPGIYVAVSDEEAPARYRGIGVRIEDDVLITAEGPRNLTAGCPKTIAEIEALMAEPSRWPGLE